MSTTWRYLCIDHEPNLPSDDAATGGHGLERMRDLYEHRAEIIAAIETLAALDFDVWNFDQVENVAVRFFRQHPTCRLAATSDNNDYLALDPPDHEGPLPRRLCDPRLPAVTSEDS